MFEKSDGVHDHSVRTEALDFIDVIQTSFAPLRDDARAGRIDPDSLLSHVHSIVSSCLPESCRKGKIVPKRGWIQSTTLESIRQRSHCLKYLHHCRRHHVSMPVSLHHLSPMIHKLHTDLRAFSNPKSWALLKLRIHVVQHCHRTICRQSIIYDKRVHLETIATAAEEARGRQDQPTVFCIIRRLTPHNRCVTR